MSEQMYDQAQSTLAGAGPNAKRDTVKRTSEMWHALGELIAAGVTDAVIGGDPVKAIQWATCAEACFWKATGECGAHDVKDVLPAGFGIKTIPSNGWLKPSLGSE